MLSLLDDYCIHQSALPVRQTAIDNPNAYDRYFANGFSRDGRYYFAFALGRYPNRQVMDAAITIQIDRTHYSFFVSADDPAEPTDMKLGPLILHIDQPMRVMTITLDRNDSGIACQLRWRSRSAPIPEKRTVRAGGEHMDWDIARWTQFGCWEGWFEIDGLRTEVTAEACPGVKDRSWGVRGVAQSPEDRQAQIEQAKLAFWNWVPLNFGDFLVHSLRFDDTEGSPVIQECLCAPMYESEADIPIHEERIARIAAWEHAYKVDREARRLVGGQITIGEPVALAPSQQIEISTPMLTAWTYGVGYNHPKWGHGVSHGGFATGHERWKIDDVDPNDRHFGLVHQIVKVRCGEKEGIGFLEQLIMGPIPKYGIE